MGHGGRPLRRQGCRRDRTRSTPRVPVSRQVPGRRWRHHTPQRCARSALVWGGSPAGTSRTTPRACPARWPRRATVPAFSARSPWGRSRGVTRASQARPGPPSAAPSPGDPAVVLPPGSAAPRLPGPPPPAQSAPGPCGGEGPRTAGCAPAPRGSRERQRGPAGPAHARSAGSPRPEHGAGGAGQTPPRGEPCPPPVPSARRQPGGRGPGRAGRRPGARPQRRVLRPARCGPARHALRERPRAPRAPAPGGPQGWPRPAAGPHQPGARAPGGRQPGALAAGRRRGPRRWAPRVPRQAPPLRHTPVPSCRRHDWPCQNRSRGLQGPRSQRPRATGTRGWAPRDGGGRRQQPLRRAGRSGRAPCEGVHAAVAPWQGGRRGRRLAGVGSVLVPPGCERGQPGEAGEPHQTPAQGRLWPGRSGDGEALWQGRGLTPGAHAAGACGLVSASVPQPRGGVSRQVPGVGPAETQAPRDQLPQKYRVTETGRNSMKIKYEDGHTEVIDSKRTPHSLYKEPKSLISGGCSESRVERHFRQWGQVVIL
jgi:hypothetical protein